jgi:hypothetical protein
MELLTRLKSDYCTLHVGTAAFYRPGTAATDWVLIWYDGMNDYEVLDYSDPSITGLGKFGSLLRKSAALPFTKRMAILWYRCLIFSDSS